MKPKFLFTLGGDLGTQVISEPEGWKSIIFNLERDLNYWSLIENFELPLIFYGTAEGKNGGYQYLSNAKNNGPDTLVTIDIQISFDQGLTYETCFDGRIDISTAKEIIYRAKIQAAIVRNDLWAVFMAKKSTPIDLLSSTDIYGNTRFGIPQQELNLPSQKLLEHYDADISIGTSLLTLGDDFTSMNGKYGQIDCDEEVLAEIKTKYSLPIGLNTSLPANLFEMDEQGSYYFDVKFEISLFVASTVSSHHVPPCDDITTLPIIYYGCTNASGIYAVNLDYYIQINNQSAIKFSKSADTGSGSNHSTIFQIQQNFNLNKGDLVRIYCIFSGNMGHVGDDWFMWVIRGKQITGCDIVLPLKMIPIFGSCVPTLSGLDTFYTFNFPVAPSGNSIPSYIRATANTITPDSECDSVLLHDAGLSICDRILGKNDSFYSEFLGGDKTAIHYASNGCGYLNALTRGKNLRGYSFQEKPFTLSFDDWWSGVNPIFNLGLGYEVLSGGGPGFPIIRVEQKSSFFNISPSVYLTAINDIQIEFDLNLFTKTIEVGFEQWAAESASGIDDPQTKHTYSVRFQLFGKDEKQLSKFIAASLTIEQGRRLTKQQNQDWRLDENTFIIALQSQSSDVIPQTSPPTITEQPEVFGSGITNLNNSDTRYNVRHTPARILQRWISFYNGQMQSYLTDYFKFQSGEGNVLMSWGGDGGCDSGSLTENQNQSVSATYLFLPIVYSFTHPLTWDEYRTIRNNRKNAISISWIDPQGNTQVKIAFIRKLGYDINKSKGTFEVWIRS